jgi:hypothetical protein
MPLRLRAGLSWCLCGGRSVFLDLARDRYFCLPHADDRAFRAWAAGETPSVPALERLLARGILASGEGAGRGPATCPPALRDLAEARQGRPPAPRVIAAAAGQLRARLSLRRTPVGVLLARIAAARSAQAAGRARDPVPDEARARAVAGAFRGAAMVLRAEDQCLPRAVAARWMCDRYRLDAALVLGVRLDPFAAHSWVQAGDAVIVGDLEQVRLFTPILVVP